MKAAGSTIKSMALGFTSGLMAVNLLESGSTAKLAASVSTIGLMEGDMKASFRRIRGRAMER